MRKDHSTAQTVTARTVSRSRKPSAPRLRALLSCVLLLLASGMAGADSGAPSVNLELAINTQGPLWPPSEIMDEDGDFVLIGQILTQLAPGLIIPIPGAALVSKNTVPPLVGGVEDFSNPLGAPYLVIRNLDLSPGSPDLDMVLHANSFGPVTGDFGGGPRIPREGESDYNLNGSPLVCPELFAATSQQDYQLASVPLHQVTIWGFQGDQKVYDVDTGEIIPAVEQEVDVRRTEPITLGEWIAANGEVQITLSRFSAAAGGYTHATFKFEFADLLPDSLYTIWAIHRNTVGQPLGATRYLPSPLGMPNNTFISDLEGRAEASFEVRHPFPATAGDTVGRRVIGLAIDFHSDFQNWGACFARLGTGVEVHNQLEAYNGALGDITDLVTVEPVD